MLNLAKLTPSNAKVLKKKKRKICFLKAGDGCYFLKHKAIKIESKLASIRKAVN